MTRRASETEGSGTPPDPRAVEYYASIATEYDSVVAEAQYDLPRRVLALLRKFRPMENISILDIGIGTGLSSIDFAGHGNWICGIDGSAEMLGIAAEKCFADRLLRADLSAGALPDPGRLIDVVICLGVLEFVMDPRRLFAGIAGFLAPSGLIALAIRDLELNPQLEAVERDGLRVDRRALEEQGIVAVFHEWAEIREIAAELGLGVAYHAEVFGYRSPTQGVETMNRLVLFKANQADDEYASPRAAKDGRGSRG